MTNENEKEKSTIKKLLVLRGDPVIWTIFFILCAISVLEVYSAGSTLSFKSGNVMKPIISHSGFLMVGFICAFIFHNIPWKHFKLGVFVWALSILMLVAVLIFGESTNESARWINLGFIKFQPSEIAKGTLILTIAFLLSSYQTKKGTDRHALKPILICTFLTCILIFSENFSTAFMLFGVVYLMMFFGRIPKMQILKLTGILIATMGIVITLVMTLPMDKISESIPIFHRLSNFKARLERFVEKDNPEEIDGETKQTKAGDFDINKEAQKGFARIAIAKSNIVGCGPGNSTMRDFLPQAYSDFIFAIVIEEFGLIGAAFLILVYVILFFRVSKIANRCERNFPAFAVLGLATLIVVQAMINMCVAVGLFPVTGQPLPLVSRGGTSIIVTSVYFGIILSVSRYAIRKKQETKAAEEKTELEPVVNEAEFQNDEGIN